MVRTTTRRTRTDVEALAAIVSGEAAERKTRLCSHGWARSTDDGAFALTDTGRQIGAIASGLIDRNDFEATIDLMGLADFVDAALAVDPVDAEAYFAGIRTVDAIVDDVISTTGYADKVDDYDPSPSWSFDARRGRVEVGFDDKTTASNFRAAAPDRFDVTKKHDERFKRNRNPRRFVVDVMGSDE